MKPRCTVVPAQARETLAQLLARDAHHLEGVLVTGRWTDVGMIAQVDHGLFAVIGLRSGNRQTDGKDSSAFSDYLRETGYELFHGTVTLVAV